MKRHTKQNEIEFYRKEVNVNEVNEALSLSLILYMSVCIYIYFFFLFSTHTHTHAYGIQTSKSSRYTAAEGL